MVTGGAGFIGINFVKFLEKYSTDKIVVVDKFTYASNESELVAMGINYEHVDISDIDALSKVFEKYKFTDIIHFAAESHVDNSIKDCMPFVMTNIVGTINLLNLSVKHNIKKFVHISTDEVFGEVPYPGKFNEYSNISPRNPYSASKASAEHFVLAYGNTYKLPYIIINSSNNYGPWQYPEKFIPVIITKIINNQTIPVYGKGDQIRDWIYIEDTCDIIYKIFTSGKINNRYCIGGDCEIKNIDLVYMLLNKLKADVKLITNVTDRLGHDIRYSTDIHKVKLEFNWTPKVTLNDGLDKTIEWIKRYEDRI